MGEGTLNQMLLSLLLVVVAVRGEECSKEEYTSMQAEFTNCTGEHNLNYHEMLRTADVETATCFLFESLVEECGKIWETCHNQQEIRKLMDMQLEGLLGQYVTSGRVELNNCSVVQDYRESGRQVVGGEPGTEGSDCTVRQAVQAQTRFQRCSHTIFTAVYQIIPNIEDSGGVSETLCDSLKNISASCPQHLATCFAPEDVEQMKQLHLVEMKDFLLKAAETKVANTSLDNCSALVFSDYYDDSYEYENPEVNRKKLEEILTEHAIEDADDAGAGDDETTSATASTAAVPGNSVPAKKPANRNRAEVSGSNGAISRFRSQGAGCLFIVFALTLAYT